MINPMNLTGKQFFVTGASQGLGRQVCITLSQLGAKVILIARKEEALKETLSLMNGNKHVIYPADLSKLEDIEALLNNIVKDNGKLDGFVHCAGIGTMKPLSMTKPKFMQEILNINTLAFVELLRNYSKKSNCINGGSVVVVSSISSMRANNAKVAYAASKGALDSIVQNAAIELGLSKKIRINAVNPGWIKTDMYYKYLSSVGEEKVTDIETRQFLGAAEPEDVSNVIAFLLSEASKQITGQAIVIDGGNTLWMD